jgi:hypothetical protein
MEKLKEVYLIECELGYHQKHQSSHPYAEGLWTSDINKARMFKTLPNIDEWDFSQLYSDDGTLIVPKIVKVELYYNIVEDND